MQIFHTLPADAHEPVGPLYHAFPLVKLTALVVVRLIDTLVVAFGVVVK